MKRAFFDESSNPEVFLIAGWIGEEAMWEHFSAQWKRVSAEKPAIARFKHHDAMSFEGEFTGWSSRTEVRLHPIRENEGSTPPNSPNVNRACHREATLRRSRRGFTCSPIAVIPTGPR